MENQKKINWEKIFSILKKVGNYTFLLLVLCSGFFIGRISHEILPKVESRPTLKTAEEITIAVDQSNRMLIIDKRTGKYDVFEDSVGISIFKMYANQIYQNQPK